VFFVAIELEFFMAGDINALSDIIRETGYAVN